MKKINLPTFDFELSTICLGSAAFGTGTQKSVAFDILDKYRSLGGNFIDTANVYGKWAPDGQNHSEQVISEWIKSRHATEMILATKGGHYDFQNPHISRVTRADVRADVEESLKTLDFERIPLYWLHRDNKDLPAGEILDICEELVKEGKLQYYGASNWTIKRLQEAHDYAKAKGYQGFSAVSNEWSLAQETGNPRNGDLIQMTPELYAFHEQHNLPAIPFTSTAHGFFSKLEMQNVKSENGILKSDINTLDISQKLKERFLNQTNLRKFELLKKLSKDLDISIAALVLSYILNKKITTVPIVGVSTSEQLDDFEKACNFRYNFKELF